METIEARSRIADLVLAIDSLGQVEQRYLKDEATYAEYRAAVDAVAAEKAKVPGAEQLRISHT